MVFESLCGRKGYNFRGRNIISLTVVLLVTCPPACPDIRHNSGVLFYWNTNKGKKWAIVLRWRRVPPLSFLKMFGVPDETRRGRKYYFVIIAFFIRCSSAVEQLYNGKKALPVDILAVFAPTVSKVSLSTKAKRSPM
jgi:hypothetical protein